MITLRPFQPNRDEGKQLYTLSSEDIDGVIETREVAVEVDFDEAAATPWYYLVEAD